jgi:uncharacterized protein (UPF0261 family)
LLVSTVASGRGGAALIVNDPHLGDSDIVLMPSVVDICGLNSISTRILANAAHAVAGMVRDAEEGAQANRPTVSLTMFGVTTPCVSAVRQALEQRGFDALVFHATGTGGRTMEKLIESGLIGGALDLTTTEVADEVVGGILPAGPERFDRILQRRIPYLLSLGALDMVNFGPPETVPLRFRERKLHSHNAQVTLMRTTPEENRQFAHWIAGKFNRATAPFTVLLPEKGVSALDAPGQPFYDPEADAALFEELEKSLDAGPRRVLRLPLHINDPAFAEVVLEEFLALWEVRA